MSTIEAGPLDEKSVAWLDALVVEGSDTPVELTVELAGSSDFSTSTELTQLQLVAVPLPVAPLLTQFSSKRTSP